MINIVKIFLSCIENILVFRKSHDFDGGIDFISMKSNQTSSELNILDTPKILTILVNDVVVAKNKVVVNVGQIVLRGQVLVLGYKNIAPIHSPVSGLIIQITNEEFKFFSNKRYNVINIQSDGKDRWINRIPIHNYKDLSVNKIIQFIYNAGIVGLGGAGFLSSKKLKYSIKKVHTLVVNAAESEPYVTSDDCLMQNFSTEIVQGCQIVMWILKIKYVVIAIEDDKNLAYIKVNNAINNLSGFEIRKIKKKYPSGSSKQLIKTLFNKEIPSGKHSIHLGIILFNVSTVFSIKRAILNGEPITERIVTLSDEDALYQKNFLVRIGTPIKHILLENNINFKSNSIILGGPITGSIVDNVNFPILKTSNSVLFLKSSLSKYELERPCIRCTMCSSACPMNLLPEQLYFYSKSCDHDKSKEYFIQECIECGICEQICPSNIPLLTYFRKEKSKINQIILKENLSTKFKKLFLSRQSRLRSLESINENIILSNSILDKKFEENTIMDKKIKSVISKKSKNVRQVELESAINRAKHRKKLNRCLIDR
ncbi:MAG: electron transport complex subunit RsxC [Buchnera aphidicola (Meitanaphis flavogallis)]